VPESPGTVFSSVFLDKNPPIDARIDEMIQWGKRFHKLGVVQGQEGNLSFRTKLGFIITGHGITLDDLTKDTVVEVKGVVFGLNKPSVYVKGQVTPSMETLLHSGIYEVLPEINVIFHTHDNDVLKVTDKIGITSTDIEQPAGSQKLVEETMKLVKLNKSIRYFVLKKHGVIALGTSMSDAGNLTEEMHNKAKNSVEFKASKKRQS
jgi:L-fuculose-phosphate aldolase